MICSCYYLCRLYINSIIYTNFTSENRLHIINTDGGSPALYH